MYRPWFRITYPIVTITTYKAYTRVGCSPIKIFLKKTALVVYNGNIIIHNDYLHCLHCITPSIKEHYTSCRVQKHWEVSGQ